jgi:hypothetical protein
MCMDLDVDADVNVLCMDKVYMWLWMYCAGFEILVVELVVFCLCNFFSNSKLIYDGWGLGYRRLACVIYKG